MKLYREWLPSILTTGTAAADRKQWKRHKRQSKLWRRTLLWCQWNTEIHVTEGTPTLSSGAGASHVNQCDWDNKSLAIWRAVYGNGGSEGCLGVHGTDGVLAETGEASVHLLLHNSNVGRRRHHLKTRKHNITAAKTDKSFSFCKIFNRTEFFFPLRPHFYINRLRTSRAPLHHFGFIQMSMLHRCFLSWHLRG